LIGQEEVNVTENVTPPPPPPPPPTPSFTIASPTQGEVLMVEEEGDDVTIVMSTTNLLLKSPGGAKKVGEGHFTVAVDDGSAETTSSKLHVLTGLELGDHTVVVELLHNDGTSYFPRLSQQVSFTIEQEEPDVYVPQTHTVTIKDFDYEPSSLTIKQTDSVTWVNEGSFPRSATCFIDGAEVFNTGVFGNGASATITFNDIMECEYYSTTHPVMKGTLIVVSNEG
jgi:plastocyanin